MWSLILSVTLVNLVVTNCTRCLNRHFKPMNVWSLTTIQYVWRIHVYKHIITHNQFLNKTAASILSAWVCVWIISAFMSSLYSTSGWTQNISFTLFFTVIKIMFSSFFLKTFISWPVLTRGGYVFSVQIISLRLAWFRKFSKIFKKWSVHALELWWYCKSWWQSSRAIVIYLQMQHLEQDFKD